MLLLRQIEKAAARLLSTVCPSGKGSQGDTASKGTRPYTMVAQPGVGSHWTVGTCARLPSMFMSCLPSGESLVDGLRNDGRPVPEMKSGHIPTVGWV